MPVSRIHRSKLLERVQVQEVFRLFPRLRLRPGKKVLTLEGPVELGPAEPPLPLIKRTFTIRIEVPDRFPEEDPRVSDIGRDIPRDHHHLSDGSFCLGSPAEVRLRARSGLPAFLVSTVIPYLYGFAHQEAFGFMPFGELIHGNRGVLAGYEELFGVRGQPAVLAFLRACSLRRRVANRSDCPCGSLLRLGKCHHLDVNRMRVQLGRRWCRDEWHRLDGEASDTQWARRARRWTTARWLKNVDAKRRVA